MTSNKSEYSAEEYSKCTFPRRQSSLTNQNKSHFCLPFFSGGASQTETSFISYSNTLIFKHQEKNKRCTYLMRDHHNVKNPKYSTGSRVTLLSYYPLEVKEKFNILCQLQLDKMESIVRDNTSSVFRNYLGIT